MDDEEFGRQLRAARKRAGYRTQQSLGDVVGVSGRMIRNYEAGKHLEPSMRLRLAKVLGEFAVEGEPVEVAVRSSALVKWRQDAVLTEYERHKYEQGREAAG